MIYELNHVGIVSQDLEKSLAFYEKVLGARKVFKGSIDASGTDVVYMQIGGGLVEFLYTARPAQGEVFGLTHMAFMSDDIDADYRRFVDGGHEGVAAPRPAGTGIGRLAFLSDPNGARVELVQRDLKMRIESVDNSVVKALDHYSLLANDQDGALSFYRDFVGMRPLATLSVPETELTMSYLCFTSDVLELLHRPTPCKDPVFSHIAVRVSNVDEALATFADQGVSAEAGTPRAAGTGIGRMAIIRDPDGVKIELLDRRDLRDLS